MKPTKIQLRKIAKEHCKQLKRIGYFKDETQLLESLLEISKYHNVTAEEFKNTLKDFEETIKAIKHKRHSNTTDQERF